MSTRWDADTDDAATFERNVNTKVGNGAGSAVNKGKVKRRLKGFRGENWKRKR